MTDLIPAVIAAAICASGLGYALATDRTALSCREDGAFTHNGSVYTCAPPKEESCDD